MYLSGRVPYSSIVNVLQRLKDSIVMKSVFSSVKIQPIIPKSWVLSWNHGSSLYFCGGINQPINETKKKTFKRLHWKNLNNSLEHAADAVVQPRALATALVKYCSCVHRIRIYLPCKAFWTRQNLSEHAAILIMCGGLRSLHWEDDLLASSALCRSPLCPYAV